MLLWIAKVVLVSLCTYLLWRHFAVKSTLANIPGPPGRSLWKGCFDQVFDVKGWKFHEDLAKKYGAVVKLPMLFGKEELYVFDPLALHHIVVKDQYTYEETSMFITTNSLVFGVSLLSTLGDHHRKQRKMLNPVFSLKHMKDLLPVLYPIAYDLRDVLLKQVGQGGTTQIDLLHWISRAALDFIGQGGFGYAFNALHDKKSSEYSERVKTMLPILFKTTLHRQILPWLVKIGTAEFRRKIVEHVPSKLIRDTVKTVDVLEAGSKTIYQETKRAIQYGDDELHRKVGMGKDILSVLLKANIEANEKDRLPEEEILGQLNTFILAGQDTTSHAISRILHLLSLHPDVQARLRDEITTAKKKRGGVDFDYDALMELPYLDAVCRETLRVYPPADMVIRTTRKDAVLPLAWPILGADGKTHISEIALKKNTNVYVSIINANRYKRIWGEDAEEWKPERWLNPLPETVGQAHLPGVYSSMMTFLGGGRACIGFKFAEMEMKLVLTMLLESFEFGKGPEVDWIKGGIVRPVLKGFADQSSRLPLETSIIKVEA